MRNCRPNTDDPARRRSVHPIPTSLSSFRVLLQALTNTLLQPSLARDSARSRHPKREVTPQDLGQSRAVAALLHD
jgi:hypothetical protein